MSEYKSKENNYFFGHKTGDGDRVYITMPRWECGWYWSFGNLVSNIGNSPQPNETSNLANYRDARKLCMYETLKADYALCEPLRNDDNLWKFCELTYSCITLKNAAELYSRGSNHAYSLSGRIRNEAESVRLNNVVLPALFTEIESIFIKKDQAFLDYEAGSKLLFNNKPRNYI
tara:strand:+ start:10107 stop:10628 length:522 start_codon:yes stop_codon:yes gene_type:complete